MALPVKNIAVVSNTNQQNKPPLISNGDITPELCYTIDHAFKVFFVHKDIPENKQVLRVIYNFQDHHIIKWLAVNHDDIIAMTWDAFMLKFRTAFLPARWEGKLKTSMLAMRQNNRPFINFYNSMAAQKLLLRGFMVHLKIEKIRDQLKANMTEELSSQVNYKKINVVADLKVWLTEVRHIDEHQAARREQDHLRNNRPACTQLPDASCTAPSSSAPANFVVVPPSQGRFFVKHHHKGGPLWEDHPG